MNSKLVAIDIGSGTIKIAVGRASKRKVVVKKIIHVPTPEEAVNNGEMMNTEILGETLTELVKAHRLSGMNAVVTIQSGFFVSREFTIPHIDVNDVASALRFEVEQFMPIDMDEHVMSCRMLEPVDDGAKYLVGLMPKRIVEAYYEILKNARLKPVAMDVNSNAMEKLLRLGDRAKDGTDFSNTSLMVADIGNDSMNMTIFENGLPQLSRTVPIGGVEATHSIATALGIDFDEAEQRKIHRADMMAQEYEMLSEDVGLNSIAKSVASDWAEQLRRMMEFYMSRHQGKNIDRILLYGGSSNTKRLDEYFSVLFSLPVSVMKLSRAVDLRVRSSEPPSVLFNAIGAIIRR